MANDQQIEAAARAVATEMGLDWERLEDRYSLKWSKQNVRKYWRDVASIVLEAADKSSALPSTYRGVTMSLQEHFKAAINGHNVMAAALSQIAQGRPCSARDIAMQALADLELDATNVLRVHAEFAPIYVKIRKG